LDMGKKLTHQPAIFNVNWFRTDDEGRFIWRGFGDNLRVLDWIMKRAFHEIDGRESPIGILPYPDDIDLSGSGIRAETVEELLTVDPDLWREEAQGIRAFYEKFGDRLPRELAEELTRLTQKLD
ncbi:MAG: phosphoenolpyruvate carboxykinase domain-containing protein, partial [Oscillospiraceae bacterium]